MSVFVFDEKNFEKDVLNGGTPVLVDFWASWCGPCRMMGPVVEQVAEEYPALKVGKVNTDENQNLAVRLGIDSIPALLLFENGSLKAKTVGFQPKQQLVAWLKANGAL